MKNSRIILIITAVIAMISGICLGMIFSAESYADKKNKDPYERLDTFAQVLSVVERNYVEDIDRPAMIDAAIHGMMRSLDPHSMFMSSSDRQEFERRTASQFVGVGIEIGLKNDELRIIMAFYGGPAQRAGLNSGDTILAVDGRDVTQMSVDELFAALRGEPGSQVKLTVRHPGKLSNKTYTLTRELVQLPLVRGQLIDDDYGYVALRTFAEGSAAKVRAQIDNLNQQTTNGLRGLILDLRKNPGGFLLEGVELANYFIPSGNIVSTRGRNNVSIQSYEASRMKHIYDMPVAVLIDEGSASASEIVAGALQDHHRAIIVGQTSFGKASVQNLFPLQDGSSVKLTIGRYYTPSGRCIQGQGIIPDVEVEDLLLQTKSRPIVREKDLENSLKANPEDSTQNTSENKSVSANTPQTDEEDVIDEPLPSISDLQLFTALQQLRAREFFMREQKK